MPRKKTKKSLDMFNSDQKTEYIKYEKTNSVSLTNYFKRLAIHEEKLGKDIVEMSEYELKHTLSLLNIPKESSRSHLISLLRGYANWAILNKKIETSSPIQTITAESIDSKNAMSSKMLKSPEQAFKILETVMSEKSHATLPNRYNRDKLIFWLLYSGLTLEEIQMLKKKDINMQTKTVKTKENREYKIADSIVELWNEVAGADCVEKTGGKEYKLNDSDYLFRTIMGNDNVNRDPYLKLSVLIAYVQRIFTTYCEETGNFIKVSPNNIRLSGIFHQLYTMVESKGYEITPEIIEDYLNLKNSNKQSLYLKIRKCMIDYEDWKLAFGLM